MKIVLFLSQDSYRDSTWCLVLRHGSIEVLQKLWIWAEEQQLTADELRNKLFVAVNRDGNSAIYWAAWTGSIKLLEALWGLSKKTQLNPDELSKMLVDA